MIKINAKQPPLLYAKVGVEKGNVYYYNHHGLPRRPAVVQIPNLCYDSLLSSSRPSTYIWRGLHIPHLVTSATDSGPPYTVFHFVTYRITVTHRAVCQV